MRPRNSRYLSLPAPRFSLLICGLALILSAVTVQTSWDLSGVPSVGIGNLAMKDRSR